MKETSKGDIAGIIRDGRLVDGAIVAARRRVARRHRQMGLPLVVWIDDHVVELQPDSKEVVAASDQGHTGT